MNKLSLLLIALGLSTLPALGQENKPLIDPPELIAARDEHLRSMQRAVVPVLTTYVRLLDKQKFDFAHAGKLDATAAVDDELKRATKQLQDANAAAANTGAPLQLTILNASYSSLDKKRATDITKNVREAFRSGAPTIKLDSDKAAAGIDPAPYAPKQTTITYSIAGVRKQKTFGEGYELNFKDDLQ